MMRNSKDIARRLRFDPYPPPDFFRRRFAWLAVAAALLGVGAWASFHGWWGERQYLPGPVSRNHATFGGRCESCHASFRDVPSTACLRCHGERVHSEFEADTPACAECHVEHRDVEVFLDVSSAQCVRCHGALRTRREKPLLHASIRSFAAHPRFSPLREGNRDPAALRFNHARHLTSDKILPADRLSCASCHTPDAEGRRMRPIDFEPHCERCHEQKAREAPEPVGSIRVPHHGRELRRDGVAAVRAAIESELVLLAVRNADEVFRGRESTLPGVAARPPVDASRSLAEYQARWRGELEDVLFKPFEDRKPLLESNKYCFLCHEQDGERVRGELPKIKPTGVPARWLSRGEFSHRKHDVLTCEHCHPRVEASERTEEIHLPSNEVCAACHSEDANRGAGNECMLCHLYHDTSKDPALREKRRKMVGFEALRGHAAP